MTEQKRKLSVDEQIEHLKNKGIKFEYCSEEHARQYLQKNNNFFKLRAYRKNYQKHADGKQAGQYIDLDFQYLVDLAVLDMELRYLLVHIALDVEHYTKMQLIKRVENSDEDGYTIVQEYIDSLGEDRKKNFLNEIKKNRDNVYCGAIIDKYEDRYPIWAFVEIIPFGRLVSFYRFCAERFNDKWMKNNYYRLVTCKEIRTRKMSNAHVQQIITLLYMHKIMVTSDGVREKECKKLHEYTQRMYKNIYYYEKNAVIKTTFSFLKLVVDSWYPIAYNNSTEKK